MGLVEDLQGWKKDLEELAVEKGKAEGRLEQAMLDLKNMGYDSLDAAKEQLEEAAKTLELAQAEAAELLETLKEKYGEFIE